MAVTITQYPSILTDIITATNSSSFYFFIGYAIALIVAYKACRCVIKDYQGFLALGPGGTPYNFAGYLKITYLRIYTLKDPFQPPSLAEACNPTSGYLHRLPRRAGSRPRVIGIAPHRQIEQSCSTQLHDAIRGACHTFAAENAGRVETGSSCFEKHGLALFLTSSSPIIAANIRSLPAPGHLNATCAGEICHLHSFVCPTEFCTFSRPTLCTNRVSNRRINLCCLFLSSPNHVLNPTNLP